MKNVPRANPEYYRLYAHLGSPYSMKVRAVLRYRRIPHLMMSRMHEWQQAFSKVRVPVMPVLEYPDGSFHNDSTPLILDLENRHPDRSIIPSLETDAFLSALIEDLADEWLSKAMYAYRWAFPEHTEWTGNLIAFDQYFGSGLERIEQAGQAFETRQVERNELLGCTQNNLPMLMHIGDSVLDALEPHVTAQPFLFGSRPSNADFALFGQICQFTLDLAALKPCQERAPYSLRWTHHVHDLSGLEGEWRDRSEPRSKAVASLLDLAGQAYLPFLVANHRAIRAESSKVRIEAHGLEYIGTPFKYQVRCLAELRRHYANLSDEARDEIDPILDRHECLGPLRDQD